MNLLQVAVELNNAIKHVSANAHEIRIPVLAMVGSDDQVARESSCLPYFIDQGVAW